VLCPSARDDIHPRRQQRANAPRLQLCLGQAQSSEAYTRGRSPRCAYCSHGTHVRQWAHRQYVRTAPLMLAPPPGTARAPPRMPMSSPCPRWRATIRPATRTAPTQHTPSHQPTPPERPRKGSASAVLAMEDERRVSPRAPCTKVSAQAPSVVPRKFARRPKAALTRVAPQPIHTVHQPGAVWSHTTLQYGPRPRERLHAWDLRSGRPSAAPQ